MGLDVVRPFIDWTAIVDGHRLLASVADERRFAARLKTSGHSEKTPCHCGPVTSPSIRADMSIDPPSLVVASITSRNRSARAGNDSSQRHRLGFRTSISRMYSPSQGDFKSGPLRRPIRRPSGARKCQSFAIPWLDFLASSLVSMEIPPHLKSGKRASKLTADASV